MNWQLINIVGYVAIVILSGIIALAFSFVALIVATMIMDKRREKRDIQRVQEPITQVRITVPRRQDVPEAYYRAFEEA